MFYMHACLLHCSEWTLSLSLSLSLGRNAENHSAFWNNTWNTGTWSCYLSPSLSIQAFLSFSLPPLSGLSIVTLSAGSLSLSFSLSHSLSASLCQAIRSLAQLQNILLGTNQFTSTPESPLITVTTLNLILSLPFQLPLVMNSSSTSILNKLLLLLLLLLLL